MKTRMLVLGLLAMVMCLVIIAARNSPRRIEVSVPRLTEVVAATSEDRGNHVAPKVERSGMSAPERRDDAGPNATDGSVEKVAGGMLKDALDDVDSKAEIEMLRIPVKRLPEHVQKCRQKNMFTFDGTPFLDKNGELNLLVVARDGSVYEQGRCHLYVAQPNGGFGDLYSTSEKIVCYGLGEDCRRFVFVEPTPGRPPQSEALKQIDLWQESPNATVVVNIAKGEHVQSICVLPSAIVYLCKPLPDRGDQVLRIVLSGSQTHRDIARFDGSLEYAPVVRRGSLPGELLVPVYRFATKTWQFLAYDSVGNVLGENAVLRTGIEQQIGDRDLETPWALNDIAVSSNGGKVALAIGGKVLVGSTQEGLALSYPIPAQNISWSPTGESIYFSVGPGIYDPISSAYRLSLE